MTPSVDNVREVGGMTVVAVYFKEAMAVFKWNDPGVSVFGEGGAITASKVKQMRESALRAFHAHLTKK